MEEHWKQIKDLEGYFVSDLGRVKRVKDGKERLWSQYKKHGKKPQNWYMFTKIEGKNYRVHRLVLSTFTENHPDLDVNHIDGDKSNNCLSNLEWCTRQQNVDHSYRNNFKGLSPKRRIKDLTTGIVYESIYSASKALNIPYDCISDVMRGKCKQTHGHYFVDAKEEKTCE